MQLEERFIGELISVVEVEIASWLATETQVQVIQLNYLVSTRDGGGASLALVLDGQEETRGEPSPLQGFFGIGGGYNNSFFIFNSDRVDVHRFHSIWRPLGTIENR